METRNFCTCGKSGTSAYCTGICEPPAITYASHSIPSPPILPVDDLIPTTLVKNFNGFNIHIDQYDDEPNELITNVMKDGKQVHTSTDNPLNTISRLLDVLHQARQEGLPSINETYDKLGIDYSSEPSHQDRQEGGRKTLDELKQLFDDYSVFVNNDSDSPQWRGHDHMLTLPKFLELMNELQPVLMGTTLASDAISVGLSQSEQGWVDVKERLPEKGVDVLVIVSNRLSVQYHNGETWFNKLSVTHWMNLPPKPTTNN